VTIVIHCGASRPLLLVVRGLTVTRSSGGCMASASGAWEPGHHIAGCLGRIRGLACHRSGHRERDCWQHPQAVVAPPAANKDSGSLSLVCCSVSMATRLQLLHVVRSTCPAVARLRHLFALGHRLLLIRTSLFRVILRLFRVNLWLLWGILRRFCICCSLSLQPRMRC
jgi:hypothetical protein